MNYLDITIFAFVLQLVTMIVVIFMCISQMLKNRQESKLIKLIRKDIVTTTVDKVVAYKLSDAIDKNGKSISNKSSEE